MRFEDIDDVPGTPAWSADGVPLGTVAAAHVPRGGHQPLLVQLTAGDEAQPIVPTAGAVLDERGLVLGFPAAMIRSGPTVDPDARLSVAEIVYVLERYGVPYAEPFGPINERVTGTGDVASVHPNVRTLPPVGTPPGSFPDGELPPIVVTKPGFEPRPDRD